MQPMCLKTKVNLRIWGDYLFTRRETTIIPKTTAASNPIERPFCSETPMSMLGSLMFRTVSMATRIPISDSPAMSPEPINTPRWTAALPISPPPENRSVSQAASPPKKIGTPSDHGR